MIRTLLVDDSELFTEQLRRILRSAEGFEIVGTASHGIAALDLAEALRPDLVTLDVRMPVMDGITTLKRLMTRRPVATVMVSSWTTEDSHLALDCLRYGAVDFLAKPSAGDQWNGDGRQLVAALRRAARATASDLRFCRVREPLRDPQRGDREGRPKGAALSPPVPPEGAALSPPAEGAVVVSAGRGGFVALLELVSRVPAGLDAAWIVALEAPAEVVTSFARYLGRFSPQPALCPGGTVVEGTPLVAGTLYLVPAAAPYLVVHEGGRPRLQTFKAPAGASQERLREALYESVAEVFGERAVAVVLADTAASSLAGLDDVRRSGGAVLVQESAGILDPEVLERAAAGATFAGKAQDVASQLFAELVGRRT